MAGRRRSKKSSDNIIAILAVCAVAYALIRIFGRFWLLIAAIAGVIGVYLISDALKGRKFEKPESQSIPLENSSHEKSYTPKQDIKKPEYVNPEKINRNRSQRTYNAPRYNSEAERERLERARIKEIQRKREAEAIRHRDAEIEEQQRKILEEELQRENEILIRRLHLQRTAELERKRVYNLEHQNSTPKRDESNYRIKNETRRKYSDAQISAMIEMQFRKIDVMEGHDFEYWCADLLAKCDFSNVEVTKGSGDHGGDVIAFDKNGKWVFQCKRYKNNVGNDAVKEAHYAKSVYSCQEAVVITNNGFTKSAMEGAKLTGVTLWDRKAVSQLMEIAYKRM